MLRANERAIADARRAKDAMRAAGVSEMHVESVQRLIIGYIAATNSAREATADLRGCREMIDWLHEKTDHRFAE